MTRMPSKKWTTVEGDITLTLEELHETIPHPSRRLYTPLRRKPPKRAARAGDGIRNRECQLGRLMPYHLATPAHHSILPFREIRVKPSGKWRQAIHKLP